MKRTALLIRITPWVVIVLVLSWHVWDWAQGRLVRQRILESVHPDAKRMVRDLRVHHCSDAWAVYSYIDVFDEEVCVLESEDMILMVYRRPLDPQYKFVSVFAGGSDHSLIDVGAAAGRSFPSFVSYTPATGPEQGRTRVDYDLDGVFEVKWPKDIPIP